MDYRENLNKLQWPPNFWVMFPPDLVRKNLVVVDVVQILGVTSDAAIGSVLNKIKKLLQKPGS